MPTWIYALDVRTRCGGQHASNVFHYKIVDPTTTDEYVPAAQLLTLLGTGGATAWLTRYDEMMSDECQVTSIRARRISNGGGNTAVAVFADGEWPGDIASPVHTQQIAAVINWIPDTAGVPMARNFIPGVPKSALIGSRWTPGYPTVVNVFIAKHLTGETIASGIMLPIVYDRVAQTEADLLEGYLSPRVGTQRRREVPL